MRVYVFWVRRVSTCRHTRPQVTLPKDGAHVTNTFAPERDVGVGALGLDALGMTSVVWQNRHPENAVILLQRAPSSRTLHWCGELAENRQGYGWERVQLAFSPLCSV